MLSAVGSTNLIRGTWFVQYNSNFIVKFNEAEEESWEF